MPKAEFPFEGVSSAFLIGLGSKSAFEAVAGPGTFVLTMPYVIELYRVPKGCLRGNVLGNIAGDDA